MDRVDLQSIWSLSMKEDATSPVRVQALHAVAMKAGYDLDTGKLIE